jgi:hypothetical protein
MRPMELFPEGSTLYRVSQQAEAVRVPQTGIWNDHEGNTWHYYLHGGGCRLTHTITGEPIDWDCPNPLTFDPWFFRFHLAWQLQSPDHNNQLVHVAEWVQAYGLHAIDRLLEEMRSEGLINTDWTLPEERAKSEELSVNITLSTSDERRTQMN